MKQNTVAIVGLGAMGARHVEAIRRLGNLKLVAVCDLRPEAIDAVMLPTGVRKYSDPEALFAEGPYDLTIIATTAPSHKTLVLAGLDAGCERILCEKPIACSLDDASEMVEAAEAKGARLSVNHARRFIPEYQWLSQHIRSEEWGRVCSVSVSFSGIGLGCIGPHAVDLIRFLSGHEFEYVSGWVDDSRGTNPRGAEYIDPGGLVVGQSSKGARFVYHQVEDASGPGHIMIDSTEGRIAIEEWNGRIEILSANHGPSGRSYSRVNVPLLEKFRPSVIDATASLIQALVEHEGEGPSPCDATDGLRSLEVIVATYASHDAAHSRVQLPLSDPVARSRRLAIT